MKSCIVESIVTHERFTPKKYKFSNKFFWLKICYSERHQIQNKLALLAINGFNYFSFNEKDHLDLGKDTLLENYQYFLKSQGVSGSIKDFEILTQLSVIGYIFNPVCFIKCHMDDGKIQAIIQIGNTFNELKPYYAGECKNNIIDFETIKNFYISPFIPLDSKMTFKMKWDDEKSKIVINDYYDNDLVLQARYEGKSLALNNLSLLKMALKYPLMSFQIIFLIHFHAMILWFMKIKYIKKDENLNLQQGTYLWKK